MSWLLHEETWQALESARSAGLHPTPEQVQAHIEAFLPSSGGSSPRGYRVAGTAARISISGVLTKSPDLFTLLFGGGNTTYLDIQAGIKAAEEDPSVKEIVLEIDSPGGQVSGLFETLDTIRGSKKPVKAVASFAASAAYALASAASSIEAVGPGSTFGSIGVVSSYYVSSSIVDVTSTNAPAKRPDPRTEEGQAVIREHLDEIHNLFATSIAEGRGTSVETINSTYGQGRVFLAAEAQRRGMIDSISRPTLRAVDNKAVSSGPGVKTMKFAEYRAAHPQEAAEAISEGVTQERERVAAHLTMGEQCGDLRIAVEAINAGVPFGHAPTQARYLSAAMNRRDITDRSSDNEEVAQATATAESPESRDLGDQLADSLEAK